VIGGIKRVMDNLRETHRTFMRQVTKLFGPVRKEVSGRSHAPVYSALLLKLVSGVKRSIRLFAMDATSHCLQGRVRPT
jgi:hypothetical protein